MNMGARIAFDSECTQDEWEKIVPLTAVPDLHGEYRVVTRNEPLNLRREPNTESRVIVEMPKGSTFMSYGFTDESGEWLLGEYALQGKIYAGYANKQYLKRKEND